MLTFNTKNRNLMNVIKTGCTLPRFDHFQERDMGERLNIILVSEGAIDVKGNPITATQVKEVCSNYCVHVCNHINI